VSAARAHELANRLHEAWRAATPIAPLTDDVPDLDEAGAYAVQTALVRLRGGTPAGYKLGFTSLAMRVQMGVDSPNYGVLLGQTYLPEPVLPGGLIHPRVEPEIALLLERELTGPGVTAVNVIGAAGAVFGALEVVDSRYRDYRFKAVDNIADNSSAAHYVLGAPQALGTLGDARLVGVLLSGNGRLLDQGMGVNALGSPLAAVAWLANRLADHGRSLPAGSLILTGGLTRAHPLAPGDTLVAEFGGHLGTVRLSWPAPAGAGGL
jgi:2-keto-4-pentenoate hydratase